MNVKLSPFKKKLEKITKRVSEEQNQASQRKNKVGHFSEVFEMTKTEAALAAGIFHREEAPIEAVKRHMRERGIETR